MFQTQGANIESHGTDQMLSPRLPQTTELRFYRMAEFYNTVDCIPADALQSHRPGIDFTMFLVLHVGLVKFLKAHVKCSAVSIPFNMKEILKMNFPTFCAQQISPI